MRRLRSQERLGTPGDIGQDTATATAAQQGKTDVTDKIYTRPGTVTTSSQRNKYISCGYPGDISFEKVLTHLFIANKLKLLNREVL